MHFPVSVGSGGSVLITVNRVAGANAVLSGVFLGGAGTPPSPPPPPPPPYETAPQGSWVGTVGVNGYDLAAWNGAAGDLAVMPPATITLEQGVRATWAGSTTDVRALQAPTGSERRATTLADTAQVRLRLSFSAPYAGTLHLYARRLGLHGPARERDRQRRHHDQDRGDHDRLQRRGLDALPGQRRLRGLGAHHRQPRGRRQRRPERRVPRRRRDAALAPAPAAAPVRDGTPGQLGRHGRGQRLRPRRLERRGGRPRGHAAGHDHARAGRPGDLGRVDHRRPGAPGADRLGAPGHHPRRHGPGPAAALVRRALRGHPPPVRASTGTPRPGART